MKKHFYSTGKIFTAVLLACVMGLFLFNNKVLQWGIGAGNRTAVTLALSAGADPNLIQGFNGMTSLMYAAIEGDSATVKSLINKGAFVTDIDNYGQPAMAYAILGGDVDTVEVISRSISNINEPYARNIHYIQLAVWRNNPAVVALLLEKGADPGSTSNAGIPPIAFSEFYGHKEVSALLINAGASTEGLEEFLAKMHESLGNSQSVMDTGMPSKASDILPGPAASSPAQ